MLIRQNIIDSCPFSLREILYHFFTKQFMDFAKYWEERNALLNRESEEEQDETEDATNLEERMLILQEEHTTWTEVSKFSPV